MGKLCERCGLFNNHFVPVFSWSLLKILVHVMPAFQSCDEDLQTPASSGLNIVLVLTPLQDRHDAQSGRANSIIFLHGGRQKNEREKE